MASNTEPCNEVERPPIPPEVIQEWNQVAEIVKSGKQVPLSSAKRALEFADEHYYFDSEENIRQARQFLDECLKPIVNQLLCQECPNKDSTDYQCIEECLKLVAKLVTQDVLSLMLHSDRKPTQGNPLLLTVLAMVFARDAAYYRETAGEQTRRQVFDEFLNGGGFTLLAQQLSLYHFSSSSQAIEVTKCLVDAVSDLIGIESGHSKPFPVDLGDTGGLHAYKARLMSPTSIVSRHLNDDPAFRLHFSLGRLHDNWTKTVPLANALVGVIETISVDGLHEADLESLGHILLSIQAILGHSLPNDIDEFHRVYRDVTLRCIESENVNIQRFGWWRLPHLASLACEHLPLPSTITVSNAGCAYVNGIYAYVGNGNPNATVGCVRYEKEMSSDATGRKCAIRLDEMPGLGSRWLLQSFENIAQPDGHYISVSATPDDWISFGTIRKEPPPCVVCDGFVSPVEESLKHQLAKWCVSNKLVERFYGESISATALGLTSPCVDPIILLLADMRKQAAGVDYCLQAHHILLAWGLYIVVNEETVAAHYRSSLVSNLFHLPDDLVMPLVALVRETLALDPSKAELFFRHLLAICSRLDNKHLSEKMSTFSDDVRLDIKKLMWSIRTKEASTVANDKDLLEGWMKLERFRPEASASLQPVVSLIDQEERLISVSMPIENATGEYFVGIRVFACCDEHSEITIATLQREDIAKCLQDNRNEVSLEAVLPGAGTWAISGKGMLLRKQGIIEAPRFSKTVIDLSLLDKTERPTDDQRFSYASMDEMARQNAGDILGTIGKLRGPCSAQMEVESRYSLLHTAVARGRSTLNKLKVKCDDESAPGIVALTDALSKAHLPMAELEAAMKLRNKKERVKGFKAYVSSLLENGEAASWLESVDASNLQALGGDANRVYQLLELNPKELDVKTLKAASAREDLFSKKQVKKLKELCCAQLDAEEEPKVALVEEAMNLNRKKAAEEVYANESERRDSFVVTPPAASATESQRRRQETTMTAVPFASTRPPSSCNDFRLLSFLKEQEHCLKGTAESFCRWLVDSEDIISVEDLATAVSDDEYLFEMLQQGDGTLGVDGFHLNLFKKAVLDTASAGSTGKEMNALGAVLAGSATTGREVNTFATVSHDEDEDKENVQPSPPSMLVCPLSGVLMTKDPVLAADGHTYELAAIADYFDKQNSLIGTAKRQLATGVSSKKKQQLQKIVDRGIVSPVTNARMENLSLAPNKVVAAIARDAAMKANK